VTPRAVDHLGTIATDLLKVDHPLGRWLVEAVAMVRTGATLEAAFDVGGGYGAACRQQAQDTALGTLAAAVPGSPSVNALAHRIAEQLAAYQMNGWPRDRDERRRPPGLAGYLFDYLEARGPTSAQRLRKILPHLVTKSSAMTNSFRG
jgi:hypothetical protein